MLTIGQSLLTVPRMIPQAEEVWGRISLPHCSRLRILNSKFDSLFKYFKYSTQSSILFLNISNIQPKVQISFQIFWIFQIFNWKFNSVFEASAANVFRVAAASGLILSKTHRYIVLTLRHPWTHLICLLLFNCECTTYIVQGENRETIWFQGGFLFFSIEQSARGMSTHKWQLKWFCSMYYIVKEHNFVSRRFYILMSTHKWHFKWCSLHKISSGH